MTRSPSAKGAGETKPTPLSEMSVTWIATGVPGRRLTHCTTLPESRTAIERRGAMRSGAGTGSASRRPTMMSRMPGQGRASLQRTIARRAPSRMK